MTISEHLAASLMNALESRALLRKTDLSEDNRSATREAMFQHYVDAASTAGSLLGYSGIGWLPDASQTFINQWHTHLNAETFDSELTQLHIGLLRILLQQPDLEVDTYAHQTLKALERSHLRHQMLRLPLFNQRWRLQIRKRRRERFLEHSAGLLFIALTCEDARIERRVRKLFSDEISPSLLDLYHTQVCGKLGTAPGLNAAMKSAYIVKDFR